MLNEPMGIGDGRDLADQTLHQTKHRSQPTNPPSPRYAASGAAVLCAFIASILAAPDLSGVLGGGLAIVMTAIAATDARYFVIPDRLVLAGLALGLVEASVAQPLPAVVNLGSGALRSLVLAALFLGFRRVYRRIRGYDGLGLGDVKLAAVAGLWLDWVSAAIAVDIAALSALAFVLIGLARGQKLGKRTRVPFGLFFAPAIWLAWLFAVIALRRPPVAYFP